MIIAITTTSMQFTPSQASQVASFLKTYLPRMRKAPGIQAIYHYSKPELAGGGTISIWESAEALKQFRASDLYKEAADFEKRMNITSTREAYPLGVSL